VFGAWAVVPPSIYLGFQGVLGHAWLLATEALPQQLLRKLVQLAGDLDAVSSARASHGSR
jgi:hypothetical protein